MNCAQYERKSRQINENDSQDFSQITPWTSAPENEDEDFKKHLDQQAKRWKMKSETEKEDERSLQFQQFKLTIISALTITKKIDRTSKLNVTVTTHYLSGLYWHIYI